MPRSTTRVVCKAILLTACERDLPLPCVESICVTLYPTPHVQFFYLQDRTTENRENNLQIIFDRGKVRPSSLSNILSRISITLEIRLKSVRRTYIHLRETSGSDSNYTLLPGMTNNSKQLAQTSLDNSKMSYTRCWF